MSNYKFLERISGDVISDMLVGVSKDETLLTLLDCPLCSISRIFQREVFVKIVSRDTISDMSSDTLPKQVVEIVDCIMMFLAKVRNFCLTRMKGC